MFVELYRHLLLPNNDIVIVSQNHNRLKRRALIFSYENIDISVKLKHKTRVSDCIIPCIYKRSLQEFPKFTKIDKLNNVKFSNGF